MVRRARDMLLLAATAGGALRASALRQSSSMNPVTKVVNMLTEMKEQVQEEADEDEKVFENHKCWCETNEAAKTQAIKDADKKLEDLAAAIEEGDARAAQLSTEIDGLKDEIAENQAALDKATEMREAEKEQYEADANDSMEAITNMREAVKVLAKVQLVQQQKIVKQDTQTPIDTSDDSDSADALVQVRRLVTKASSLRPTDSGLFKSVMQRDLWDMLGSMPESRSQARVVTGLVEQPTGNAAGATSYSAQSSQILGLLNEMKDEFERDLTTAQKAELHAEVSFQKLRSSKMEEILAAGKSMEDKEAELADTHAMVAQAKDDIVATREQKASDEKFLKDLKERCANADEEYAARQKTRQEEMLAIADTINILTGDESRDLFSKTQSFLQTSSRHTSRRSQSMSPEKSRAISGLLQYAKKYTGTTGGMQMAALAIGVQLDGFEKVKSMMDKMIAELKKQQAEEVEKNDQCKKDIHENEMQIKTKDDEKEDLVALIGDLEAQIKRLDKEMEDLKASITFSRIELKRASEDRKVQNKEFQQVVSDQKATAVILNKALDRLKQFYGPKLLLQKSARIQRHRQEPPPAAGKEYGKNQASGGVMSTIEMIIQEAEAAEKEAVTAEQNSQAAYAQLVKDTNTELEEAQNSLTTKTEERAKADADRITAEKDAGETLKTLENLHGVNGALHSNCDYVIKYFNIRQQARGEEIEAVQEAKAILSGADFGF